MKDSEKVELWRQRYFEAQAAAEEFVLREHGQRGIDQWIAANAAITARLLSVQRPSDQSELHHFMTRLLAQLLLYESDASLTESDGAFTLANTDCGILRYRKEAAAKGVNLTYESPCEYCQSLNTAIVQHYAPDVEVTCHLTDKGCEWRAADVGNRSASRTVS